MGKMRVRLNNVPHNQWLSPGLLVVYLSCVHGSQRVLAPTSNLLSAMGTPDTTSAEKEFFNPPPQGSPSPNFPNLAKLWKVAPAFDVSVTLLFQGLLRTWWPLATSPRPGNFSRKTPSTW